MRQWRLGTALVVAAIGFGFATAGASARTFVVTKKGDPVPDECLANDCSLREAILAANDRKGADVVELPSRKGKYVIAQPTTLEDDGLEGDFDVLNDPLAIVHPGKGTAKVSGEEVDRVFDVHAGARTTFRKLVIRDGDQPATEEEGGGIQAAANVKLIQTRVSGNEAAQYGGGVGLIDGAGLTVTRSVVSGNVAASDGAGVDGDNGAMKISRSRLVNNDSGSNGGAIYFFSNGVSTISNSTIAGNEAVDSGGALFSGDDEMDLRITNSTISGNETAGPGGGIDHDGGTLRLTNSTVAKNAAAGPGGGISLGAGTVHMNAVTVAFNRADSDSAGAELGGGLAQGSSGYEIENSLIALNRAGDGARNDCVGEGPFDSLGHNLLSRDTDSDDCEGFDSQGDLVRGNPKLKRLARNGGPTLTVALKGGSPAIGKAKRSTAPGRDQRGVKRDRRPDIGAFELR